MGPHLVERWLNVSRSSPLTTCFFCFFPWSPAVTVMAESFYETSLLPKKANVTKLILVLWNCT